MTMIDPTTPNLKKLIADNTIKFVPSNSNVRISNQEFKAVINALVNKRNSDWYLDHQDVDINQQIIDCWLRVKSHRLVCLRLEVSGAISTVFMRSTTAHKFADLITKIVNDSILKRHQHKLSN